MINYDIFIPTDEEVVQMMNMLERRALHTYHCNRPPRPSAAFIVYRIGTGVVYHFGDVQYEGPEDCLHDGCLMEHGHCVRNLHAEVDAILGMAQSSVPTKDMTMFSINKPCHNCTQHIIGAGIGRVYYKYTVYDQARTVELINANKTRFMDVGELFNGNME